MKRRLAAAALAAAALPLAACGSSPTEDDVANAVPADARAYVHLDRAADDWETAAGALAKLPALETVLRRLLPSGAESITLPEGEELGLVFTGGDSDPLVLEPGAEPLEQSLDDSRLYHDLLDGLPEQRFVHGYAARAAVGALRELDSSITAAAAALDVDGELMRVRLRLAHDAPPGRCSEGAGGSDLVEVADPAAALYLEIPSIGCAVRSLAARTDGGGAALGRFARAAERRGGISLEDDLLPLLDRRGALIVAAGERAPRLTLVVDGIDEEQALDVLTRLQPALIDLLGTAGLGRAPSFGAAEVEGVTAATAQLSPALELSYAAWDGRLVVSTSLDGIAEVRRAEGLQETEAFDAVLADRPDSAAALVFLDLDQLLALGEQAGLAADPRYLAVRDDLQKLHAAGAVLSREEKFTTAELTFHIP